MARSTRQTSSSALIPPSNASPTARPVALAPCWESVVENATQWEPSATLRITIHLVAPLAAGSTYYVKFVTSNGASDSRYFTL